MGCNLSEEQINAYHVCKSQGGLTANVKLHFFSLNLEYVFHSLIFILAENLNTLVFLDTPTHM